MELLVLSSLFLGETLWYDSGSQVSDIAKHFAWGELGDLVTV
jgi:hypothetical protein